MTTGAEKLLQLSDVELAYSQGSPKERRKYLTLIEETATARRGGLGETVRVRTMAGELLACKKLLLPERDGFGSQDSYDAELSHRERAFREEYDTLCRLSNFRGFVKARAYGRMGDMPVILMEWVEGVSAGNAVQFLKRTPDAKGANPLSVAQIGRDVFHLLARLEAEAELFVHRDLSASNIMIRTSERPLQGQIADGYFDICFIDFGSAATLRAGDGTFTTDTRILRGATPGYAPPEMLSNDLPGLDELRKSTKIDVYAASSVLYEMLCGHLPFDVTGRTGTGSDYLFKMMNDPAPTGFPEGTMERLLADVLCRGICATQDARCSSYAMYKMLEFYVEHFDENTGRATNCKDLLTLDPRTIDRPDLRYDQISLSNPLASSVRRTSETSAEPGDPERTRTSQGPAQAAAAAPIDGSVETAAMTASDARALSAANAARAAARASYGQAARAPQGAAAPRAATQRPQQAAVQQRQPAHPAGYAARQGVGATSPAGRPQGAYAGQSAPNAGAWQQSTSQARRQQAFAPGAQRPQKGVSALPKVAAVAVALAAIAVAVVVAVVLLPNAGGGSATNGGNVTTRAESEERSSDAGTTASPSDDDGLTGTWSGKMVTTSSGPACYGAESYPLKLTFTEAGAGESGTATCDVEVLYHAHNRNTQAGDALSSAGDVLISADGVRGTKDNGRIVMTIDESSEMGRDSSIAIECKYGADSDTIEATVTSYFSGARTEDVYSLTKQ